MTESRHTRKSIAKKNKCIPATTPHLRNLERKKVRKYSDKNNNNKEIDPRFEN